MNFPGSKWIIVSVLPQYEFKWLNLTTSSLFLGEKEERMTSPLTCLNQTAWKGSGQWGLSRSPIILSSKPYKLFTESKREPRKTTHIDNYCFGVLFSHFSLLLKKWKRLLKFTLFPFFSVCVHAVYVECGIDIWVEIEIP